VIIEQNAADVAKYCSDVLDGKITAGDIVRAAVLRYLEDSQREGDDDFPYYHDADKASAVIDFFPNVLRHSIGDAAGTPFHLNDWQKFIIWNLFGWLRVEDETRRFRRAFISVARKNGKSTFAAGISIFMACLDFNPATRTPEEVSNVFLSATKKDQADVIYGEIKRMMDQSPLLSSRGKERYSNIEFSHNQGTISKLGSDKPFHGLNPHMVCMDELHNWGKTHKDFYDSMLSGSGNRLQPLILSITTAGDDRSYIWMDEWKYANRVARREVKDEAFFGISYEIDKDDDPLEPKNWPKANPNLGVSVNQDYLEQQTREARESPMKLNFFTRFYGNRLVSAAEVVFDVLKWDKCEGELSDWSEADAIGAGVDLGARDDLAAFGFCARLPTGETNDNGDPIWRYEFLTKSYIAEDTSRDLTKPPFVRWVHEGLIQVEKYPIDALQDDLIEHCRRWRVESVAYDQYNAQPFAEALERKGIRTFTMAQTTGHFNEPIQDLHGILADGRCTHDGNPMLRWCITNAVGVMDRSERVMLAKRDSADKIDPLVAMLMALKVATKAKSKPKGSLCSF
jgi:phage terminase large subunit-like protein